MPDIIAPVSRIVHSLMFIASGLNHFSSGGVAYAAQAGIPLADILVPVSGLIIIIGGISVLMGFHTRVGATLLLLFLVPTTILMHDFWSIQDPLLVQSQLVHFLKNLALMAGALLFIRYGAGPVSLDEHKLKKVRRVASSDLRA